MRSLGIDHKQLEVVLVKVELLLGDVLQRGELRAQSSSSAWPAVQRMEAFWSRPPVEAPAISFSDLNGGVDEVTRPASEIAVAEAVHVVQSQSGGAGHGGGGAQAGASGTQETKAASKP